MFGRFRLDPLGRTLSEDEQRVAIAPRLLDTLLYLVENHGRLVERGELVQAVWPGRVIEDGNLAKAISSLRTVLRRGGQTEDFIVTAPGRGYRFVAPVMPLAPDATLAASRFIAASTASKAGAPSQRRSRTMLGLGILAASLAALWIGTVLFSPGSPPAPADRAAEFAPPPRSVAVLPFGHADPADEQFSDGVSEELINALGRVGPLRVAGRLSSFSLQGRKIGIGEIARLLNVATVLEGSVRRDGAHLRISAQLIDAKTGYQLWAQEYDRDQVNLLSMERQIAEAVIASLKIVLAGRDAAMLTLGGTDDPPAFDAYLAGMASLARKDEDTNEPAIAAFGQAIARDPHYALAYAQRARALAYKAVATVMPDLAARRAVLVSARRDAEAAVAIAPDLGAAHAALALVLKLGLSDFGLAQSELQRAMTLSPGDVAILMDEGFFELDLGHEKAALAAAEHAVALDPLTPKTYKMLAEILAYERRFDEAFTALRHAGALRPADPGGDRLYREILQQLQGDAAGAQQTCTSAPGYFELACLAWADQKLGRQAQAEAALARLHTLLGDDGDYLYARIAAQWSRREEALSWLRKAYDVQDAGLIAIKVDPFMATLSTAPDTLNIEKALGFPP